MASKNRSTSLFDDIFQLQSTVPDFDPEDPEDGFKSGLTEGATEVETFELSQLRTQTAIIPDDPKYRGKKTSRKSLYSDDEECDYVSELRGEREDMSDLEESDEDEDDEEESAKEDDDDGEDEEGVEMSFASTADEKQEEVGEKKDAVIMAPTNSNDRKKGMAVAHQLGLWDDLIKCRISLQKVLVSCNRLPRHEIWKQFDKYPSFHKESTDANRSMMELLSSMMELQQHLFDQQKELEISGGTGLDEEITSESEVEDEKETATGGSKVKTNQTSEKNGEGDDEELDQMEGDGDESEEDDDVGMDYDDEDGEGEGATGKKKEPKEKMSLTEIEEELGKSHDKYINIRNITLKKWDEKTRLSMSKIKSKNFAAFDVSVLTQIQQVLGNKGRLIRRIHQNRSNINLLGDEAIEDSQTPKEMVVEDDEDVAEVEQRMALRPDLDVNYAIVDDSDFYQNCLRDFIQLKQNEETEPVLVSKHWLAIQNLRKKHKRKVDTRASKGRKIRYHVKEKLKNFMAPYNKATWSEEQRDDLFKGLFGGQKETADKSQNGKRNKGETPSTIDIGL